jgi:hypothetical protein
MSATFSWGSNEGVGGTVINANATNVNLPTTATDADLALIAHICKQLQSLDLESCDKITDNGLFTLAGLQQLQWLDTRASGVTAAGLAAFEAAQQKAKAAASSGGAPAAASSPPQAASKAQQQRCPAPLLQRLQAPSTQPSRPTGSRR